jgi:hypothetical protein
MVRVSSLLALLVLFVEGCSGHPSDDEMIAHFHEHRSEFIELRELAQADERLGVESVGRWYLDADWEEDPPEFAPSDLSLIPPARRQAYRDLMDKLGIKNVTMWPSGVGFLASARGIGVSGSIKSYTWTEVPPPIPIVSQLDEPLPKEGFYTEYLFHGYRRIEDDWYLFFAN